MLTPQQIQDIRFEKTLFHGYDMDSVDELLEPLTQDYLTLYKENSVLKSKMRILVEKLEEYRKQESSMQNAIVATQKTCDQMLADTEKQCAKLLHEAEETVKAKQQNVGLLLGEEQSRLAAAQEATAQFIRSIEKRLKRQLELLEELREQSLPHQELPPEPKQAFDFDKNPSAPTTQEKADMLIEEIGQRIELSLNDAIPAAPVAAAAQDEDEDEDEEPDEDEEDEADEDDDEQEPQANAPVKPAPTHGDLSPEKQKIFEELRFGRAKEQAAKTENKP